MKAAVLIRHGKALYAFEIREVPDPTPSENEVLIQIEAFGLNFADVLARNGLYREAPPLPSILGYDAVGKVIGIGPNVDRSWLGKRVAALTRFGSYAEKVATSILGMCEIPDDMPAGVACALGTQYCTAYYSMNYVQQMHKGEKALVHAARGGVGTALVQLLLWKGVEVYGTAGSDEKIAALQQLGVKAINYNTSDYEVELAQQLQGKRLDATFNSIAGTSFKKDMKLLGSGGRLVLYGFAERSGKKGGKLATAKLLYNMGLMLPIMLLATSKSVIGVNMLKIADYQPHVIGHCMRDLVQLYQQGIVKPLVGGEFAIDQLATAHDQLEHRKTTGKLIVKW
jgi:NADPH:quinone reductase-like Zn-dependent oxidoreductase